MIYTIIRKEALDNIQSKVFVVSLVFMLIISAVCSFVLVYDFNEKNRENIEYSLNHEQLLNYISPGRMGGIWMTPVRPLPKLGMLFHSVSDIIGLPSIDRDTVPLLFPKTDFFLIIGFFMSMIAILFSFSSVSGEKEEGMLRAIFSNPLKRAKLLIGKLIGGVISLMIPFSACYIFALLVAVTKADVIWSLTEWLSLASIYVLGLIYISLFYLIGLYVSTKTSQPHISMLIALLIWAFLVLVMPTLPDYLGKEFFPAPSATNYVYDNELKYDYERKEILRKIRKPYYDRGFITVEIDSIAKDEINAALKTLQEQRRKGSEDFQKKIMSQFLASTAVAMLSPFASFTLAGNELAATGFVNQLHFIQQRSPYESALWEYIRERQKEERAKDRKVDWNTQLDLSSRPKFEYKEIPFILRIAAATVPAIFLILFNILFFVLAVKAFLRYDVR